MRIENNLTPKETRQLIEKEFSVKDLSLKSRKEYIKTIRHLYMYFAYLNENINQESVSKEIKRTHACCINSIKVVNNALDTKNKDFLLFFERASKVIVFNQKGGTSNLKKRLDFHLSQIDIIQKTIDKIELEKKQIHKQKKELENIERTEKAQILFDNLMIRSERDQILRDRLNIWMESKKSTDLIQCTKIIGFKHYEDFQTFSDLNRSIQ